MLEEGLYSEGKILVAGIDEAGRGPLAGPVAAACVILPKGIILPGVNESKRLSPKRRVEFSEIIKKEAVCYNIALASIDKISEINILQATFLAMKKAAAGMKIKPEHVLVDGSSIPDAGFLHTAVKGGDEKSISIAAASILAKVYRDSLMIEYAKLYPEYGFETHKGYGTVKHIEAIKKYGPCPIHRTGFIKKFIQ